MAGFAVLHVSLDGEAFAANRHAPKFPHDELRLQVGKMRKNHQSKLGIRNWELGTGRSEAKTPTWRGNLSERSENANLPGERLNE